MSTNITKVVVVLLGYNVTILAYGQTGSGKTHSMGTNFENNFGDRDGVILQAIKQIFDHVKETGAEKFSIKASYIELYQERIYDLMSPNRVNRNLKENQAGVVFIPGLTERCVTDVDSTLQCLEQGSSVRTTGATAMNVQSSRSHCLFTLTIKQMQKDGKHKTAKFQLVDLAGSERSQKTKAIGERLKESNYINKGLLTLGNVITALCKKSPHVPYRDSKLTRLLESGNSVTLLLACICPTNYNIKETVSTLRYAYRALKIKNKPIINQDSITKALPAPDVEEMRAELTQQMLNDQEKFTKFKLERDREIRQLKENAKKQTNKMIRMKRLHLRQLFALKHKLDIAHKHNRRLKNALVVQKLNERKLSEKINHYLEKKIEKLKIKNEYDDVNIMLGGFYQSKSFGDNYDSDVIDQLRDRSFQEVELSSDLQVINSEVDFTINNNVGVDTSPISGFVGASKRIMANLLEYQEFINAEEKKFSDIIREKRMQMEFLENMFKDKVAQLYEKETVVKQLREELLQKDELISVLQSEKHNTQCTKRKNSPNAPINLEFGDIEQNNKDLNIDNNIDKDIDRDIDMGKGRGKNIFRSLIDSSKSIISNILEPIEDYISCLSFKHSSALTDMGRITNEYGQGECHVPLQINPENN